MNSKNSKLTEDQKIAIPTKKGYIFIHPIDIIRCEANKNSSICILKNNIQTELSLNMKKTEAMLKEHGFLRVHHAHLINIRHIEKYEKEKQNHVGGVITLTGGEIVTLSKRKKSNFLKLLKNNFISDSLESPTVTTNK